MRNESWGSVLIEFVLVIAGVFLGIVAANWNEERLERRETAELLEQLRVEMELFRAFGNNVPPYYASAAGYASQAEAGWRGDPAVDDQSFVIAAYQASQITSVTNDNAVWGAIFGADRLRDIEDTALRQALARIMTFDYSLVDLRSVSTRYREEVRKTIPDTIQAAIRARCGDRPTGQGLVLPPRCDLDLPSEEVRAAARALRARADLPAELNWHRAAVANQMTNIAALRFLVDALIARLERKADGA